MRKLEFLAGLLPVVFSHPSILSKSDASIGEEIEEVSIEGPELSDKVSPPCDDWEPLLVDSCSCLLSSQFEGSTEDVSVSQLSQAHGAAYMEDVS